MVRKQSCDYSSRLIVTRIRPIQEAGSEALLLLERAGMEEYICSK